MRVRTFVLAAALAWTAGDVALTCAGQSAPQTGSLAGRIVDATSGEPVEGASVVLRPGELKATTTAAGRFAFTGLPPGLYQIEIHHIVYRSYVSGPILVSSRRAPALELRLERDPLVEKVVVRPEHPVEEKPSSRGMTREEILRTPGTLGDPLRGLTSVPGVATVNDFKA